MTSNSASKPTQQGLLDFYRSILGSLGTPVNEEDMVSMEIGGQHFPCKCNGRRVVIPTPKILKESQWDKYIAFHPLSENVYRGESPMLKKLRALVNFRLSSVLSVLVSELTEIAADTDQHSKLSPRQSDYLSTMKDADGRTVKDVEKVLDNIGTTQNRLVSIYLKRGGKFKGEEFSRVAITSFPIMDEFENEDRSVFGVKLRVKDFKGLKALIEYIVPNATDLDAYSYGSNSMSAPYFHVLMHAYLKVAKRLNKVVKMFKSRLDKDVYEGLLIDTSWESEIDDISKYRDLVPVLDGNDGELCTDGEEAEEAQAAPVTEKAPKTRGRSGGVFAKMAQDLEEADKAEPQVPAQATQAPTAPPWEAAPQAPVAPVAPTATAPQPQADSDKGLSWKDVVNRQPALQQAAAPPGFAGQPFNPNQPQPGWGGQPQQPQWRQPQAQNTFATHPRNQMNAGGWNQPQQQWGPQQAAPQWNQPQQPQWNQPQQNGPVYPGGI